MRLRGRSPPGTWARFGIGVLGGAVGVILGTLRMPALVRGVGLGAKARGRLDERVLRLALGVMLVVVGVAFAAQAVL